MAYSAFESLAYHLGSDPRPEMNPEEMEEAEETAYWLEIEDGEHTIYEGETKEESEPVFEGDEWFTGIIQEVDRNAGDFNDSRLYKFRSEEVDGAVLFWGKADVDRKVDNAALQTADEVAIRYEGGRDVTSSDGKVREMNVYDVRYEKA